MVGEDIYGETTVVWSNGVETDTPLLDGAEDGFATGIKPNGAVVGYGDMGTNGQTDRRIPLDCALSFRPLSSEFPETPVHKVKPVPLISTHMPGQQAFDRLVYWLVHRISGTTAFILTLLLYPGFGLVIPLALGWPTFWLVLANVLGVVVAAVVALGWFGVQVDVPIGATSLNGRPTSDFSTRPSSNGWLGSYSSREGWDVTEVGRADGPDGNIDLELRHGKDKRIVQCKRWTTQIVGVDEIRRFLGTLLREKLLAGDGIFVTLSRFGEQARQEAREAGLTLIDSGELVRRLEGAQRPEACPECKAPMILDDRCGGGGSGALLLVVPVSVIWEMIRVVRTNS